MMLPYTDVDVQSDSYIRCSTDRYATISLNCKITITGPMQRPCHDHQTESIGKKRAKTGTKSPPTELFKRQLRDLARQAKCTACVWKAVSVRVSISATEGMCSKFTVRHMFAL